VFEGVEVKRLIGLASVSMLELVFHIYSAHLQAPMSEAVNPQKSGKLTPPSDKFRRDVMKCDKFSSLCIYFGSSLSVPKLHM